MIRDYAVAVAMQHGHDPREVREYSWRDLELLLTVSAGAPDFGALLGGP